MPYCFSMISRLSGLLLTLVVSQGLCFVPSPLRATRRIIRMAAENEVPEEVTRVRISSPRGDGKRLSRSCNFLSTSIS